MTLICDKCQYYGCRDFFLTRKVYVKKQRFGLDCCGNAMEKRSTFTTYILKALYFFTKWELLMIIFKSYCIHSQLPFVMTSTLKKQIYIMTGRACIKETNLSYLKMFINVICQRLIVIRGIFVAQR